jgi:enamine deaminase RidA (YjgF/YER057c/UK114 family)
MNQRRNPAEVAPPGGSYSHSIEVPPNARWLYISGQVGVARDGSLPSDLVGQATNCWNNIRANLAAAGMEMGDLVKITVFLTRESDVAAYREARDRILKAPFPASTLVVVSRLVRPEWLIEIEAVAAKG